MVKVLTKDGYDVEVTHCDAGYPPDSPVKFPILNTTAVWFRPDGGEWLLSVHRSAIKTAGLIRCTRLNELEATLCENKKENHEEEAERSGGGVGET